MRKRLLINLLVLLLLLTIGGIALLSLSAQNRASQDAWATAQIDLQTRFPER